MGGKKLISKKKNNATQRGNVERQQLNDLTMWTKAYSVFLPFATHGVLQMIAEVHLSFFSLLY